MPMTAESAQVRDEFLQQVRAGQPTLDVYDEVHWSPDLQGQYTAAARNIGLGTVRG